MIGATGLAMLLRHSAPLLIGLGSLAGLIVRARRRWTPHGEFGRANAVTLARASLLLGLPAVSARPFVLVGLSLLFLAADGIDGWLARRDNATSTFGAFFDKEADALFVLLLCVIAVLTDRLPFWMIGVGLLRYAFVVAVFLLDPPEKTEPRSSWGRYVHGSMVGTLLLVFLPLPAIVHGLVYGAAAALLVSFGHSFQQILRSPTPLEPE